MEDPTPTAPPRPRPAGVILLAVLFAAWGLYMLFFALPTLGAGQTVTPEESAQASNHIFYVWFLVATALLAAVGLAFLAAWARWLTITASAIAIVYPLWAHASHTVTRGVLLQVLFAVAVIIYLVQPSVRKAFAA